MAIVCDASAEPSAESEGATSAIAARARCAGSGAVARPSARRGRAGARTARRGAVTAASMTT